MTQIVCHRGYSGRYPENTLLAFQKALETGAEGMELDVHLSKDGEVVSLHDELLDRTTDGTGFVRDYTLAELKKLNAAKRSRERFGFQPIPTLREYFELVQGTAIHTNIELKTGTFDYPGLEEAVWDLIREYRQEDKVLISSFHAQSLLRMHELAPELPCGLLNKDALPNAGRVICSLGFQAYHPHFIRLTPGLIRDLKAHGLQINTYVPNGPATLAYLFAQDVSSVITNYPERALRLRRAMQGRSCPSGAKK